MASVIQKLLSDLAASPPQSKSAEALRHEAEHVLMKILLKNGLRGAEHALGRIKLEGEALRPESGSQPAWCRSWRKTFDRDGRQLEVSVMDNGDIQSSSIEYQRTPLVRLRKRQRELAAVHEAFYARYNKVAARAYRNRGDTSLSKSDRRLLLVAELEAEVNNGGFGQYLHNKGRRRARSAVVALRAVGANKTQAMLEAALAPNASEKRLAQLDDRFYRSSEDLAALVMGHLVGSRVRA